jgi:hypothetical protein
MPNGVEDFSAWRFRRDPLLRFANAWWMRLPRQNLTLGSLLLSLVFWVVVLPAVGIF